MRFLVLQHAPHEGPGRYEELAGQFRIKLATVRLWEPGYRLPSPDQYMYYDGALIMGGPQGVNDTEGYPSRDEEIAFIREFDKPILGTCLGSQLGAAAFGGRVYSDGRKECGFYNARSGMRRGPLFRGFDETFPVFHWHGDSFEIPQDAVPLAYSQSGDSVQAFSYDKFFGTLFHTEMTREMIGDLLRIDRKWFEEHPAYHGNTGDSIMQRAAELDGQMARQAEALFLNFVSIAGAQAHQRQHTMEGVNGL